MLLYTYFQKTRKISRREYNSILQSESIAVNWTIVTSFDVKIKIWDTLQINWPWDSISTEHIEYFPWFTSKLVLFNKPLWCVCSKKDPHNKIIYHYLPKSWHDDFWYIWRLDKDSSWLLLLTNDSSYVDYYENPFHDVHKVYEITLNKALRSKDIKKMKIGQYVTRDGELSTEQEMKKSVTTDFLKCVSVTSKNINWKNIAIITLNEWKYRHIRRLLQALWYRTITLKRIKIGKRHLWDIKPWKRKIENTSRSNARMKKLKLEWRSKFTQKKKKKTPKKKIWKKAKRAKKKS